MTTELTKISGIGISTAKDLSEAGFDSIESIANATPESLSEVKGFGAARVTRTITAAKELLGSDASQKEPEEVKETPAIKTEAKVAAVVTPVVTTEKKTESTTTTEKESTKYWNSSILVPVAVVVFLAFAVIYFGKVDIANNFNSLLNDAQTFVNGSSDQNESEKKGSTVADNQNSNANQNTDANQSTDVNQNTIMNQATGTNQNIGSGMASNSEQSVAEQQIDKTPDWVKEQRKNEPEWVKEQRAKADEYRKNQIAKSEAFRNEQRAKSDQRRQSLKAQSDEFRAIQLAKAEKQQEEAWKRYLASLPPAEAKRVEEQKAFADEQQAFAKKQMEEAKKRHIAMIEQQKAKMKNRYGS